jgi:putative transposase
MAPKTHILRLESVVPHGVGGTEAGIIDLIYAFLLQEYGQDIYSYIHVNQIGEDLDEVIIKDGKNIYINVRYPAIEGLEQRSTKERNRIRLDVAHTALLKIAEYEKKLDVTKGIWLENLSRLKMDYFFKPLKFVFMKRNTFSESQILAVLKEQEAGVKVADICRKHGISDATFFNWKNRYGGMTMSEIKRVKELEEENARLKKMYANLSLEHEAVKEMIAKKL